MNAYLNASRESEFFQNISNLFKCDPSLWGITSGSEIIKFFLTDIKEGILIDAPKKVLKYPVTIREGNANAIITLNSNSVEEFISGKSLANLKLDNNVLLSGNSLDLFKACYVLDKIGLEIKKTGDDSVMLH